jgi:hypothetical protein
MNEILFTPLIIILLPIFIVAWANILYLIFNRKKEINQDLSIMSIMSLYLFSLVPLGLFVGYHLMNKKVKTKDGNYKYSEGIRQNGNLILIISIASTLFSLINLSK